MKTWQNLNNLYPRFGKIPHLDLLGLTNGQESLTLKELVTKLSHAGGAVTGRASVNPRGVGAGFATHIIDVGVDAETGKTQVLRYTAVQDVGKANHPSYVEGQIQGGTVQGIGGAA